jgi:hypothetical protein
MYQVTMTNGNQSQVYGTYSSKDEAEAVASQHRATHYWNRVEVK